VTKENFHVPVLFNEVIQYLAPREREIIVDGTLGGGGHALEILKKIGPQGRLIGIDQDPEAIEFAKKTLSEFNQQVIFIEDNFINLRDILAKLKIGAIDGLLLDLGVSTFQLETTRRGFSFSEKENNLQAPLDMRMNPHQPVRAYEIVNFYSEKRLRKILFELGEEPQAKRIAHRIVEERKKKKLETCGDLLRVVRMALPPQYRFSRDKGRWASKVFRAIRMEVNQELVALEETLPQTFEVLNKGGRLVVISFHSLEDRLVKNQFLNWEKAGLVEILTQKPVMATQEEIEKNPKADSAKLRVLIKL
jgi:16S rRNA (cytosine1402-N4)-methyltransferase